MLVQLFSVLGAIFLLGAFFLSSTKLSQNHKLVKWLNLVGSTILAVIATIDLQYGFMILEGVWALVSLYNILKKNSI